MMEVICNIQWPHFVLFCSLNANACDAMWNSQTSLSAGLMGAINGLNLSLPTLASDQLHLNKGQSVFTKNTLKASLIAFPTEPRT